jgi:hypothetical protein
VRERLFIGLYLDEDVSVIVAQILRARGYEALTARDAAMLGRTDEEQLRYASAQQLALLKHNRDDFLRLHEEWLVAGRHHAGIIAAFRRPVPEITSRLLALLNEVLVEEIMISCASSDSIASTHSSSTRSM